MAFIGAGFQFIRGITEIALNKKKIKKLEKHANTEVLSFLPEKKQLQAKVLLKQTEHLNLLFNNACRQSLGSIEKEIIALMKENIEQKKKELQKKKATQFDVANLLLTIQKLSHETLEEHHKFTSNVNKHIGKLNKFVVYLAVYSLIMTCCVVYLFTVVK
jgi:hypothetical protein